MSAIDPAAVEMQRVTSVLICRECDAVYLPKPGCTSSAVLPCGHRPSCWITDVGIVNDVRDSQFIHWADSNGYLEEAIEGIHEAGGHFDPNGLGSARLTLPED